MKAQLLEARESGEVTSRFSELRYQPGIDGLRALAVTMVVLYHAGLAFPGGFVGVDVFFVISGYLITSIILQDLEANRFSMRHFWERRIRRIIPAQVVVVLSTAVAAYFLFLPVRLKELGEAMMAQALMSANMFFMVRGNYFDRILETNPLVHMWSLAIEEQFYLIFPLVLWGICLFWKQPAWRGWVRIAVGAGCLLSMGIGIWLTGIGADRIGFYALPARAWELLWGSLLAVVPSAFYLEKRGWRVLVGGIGLAAILGPSFCYHKTTPFPGLAAIPPCLGAFLVIYSFLHRKDAAPEGLIFRALTWKPMVLVGLLSYSLYLWHQPVLSLVKQWHFDRAPTIWDEVTGVVLSLILALTSWHFVEKPFRRKGPGRRPAIFLGGAAAVGMMVGTGWLFYTQEGYPGRFRAETDHLWTVMADREHLPDPLPQDEGAVPVFRFGMVDPDRPGDVMLMGDSHAMQLVPALDEIFEQRAIQGLGATRSATPPVMDEDRFFLNGERKKARKFQEGVLDVIRRHEIRQVVLAASWVGVAGRAAKSEGLERFEKSFRTMVERLQEMGCEVTIVISPPSQEVSPVEYLIYRSWWGTDSPYPYVTAEKYRQMSAPFLHCKEIVKGVRWIDLAPRVWNAREDRYDYKVGDIFVYRDNGHITKTASEQLFKPVLEEGLADLLRKFGTRPAGRSYQRVDEIKSIRNLRF